MHLCTSPGCDLLLKEKTLTLYLQNQEPYRTIRIQPETIQNSPETTRTHPKPPKIYSLGGFRMVLNGFGWVQSGFRWVWDGFERFRAGFGWVQLGLGWVWVVSSCFRLGGFRWVRVVQHLSKIFALIRAGFIFLEEDHCQNDIWTTFSGGFGWFCVGFCVGLGGFRDKSCGFRLFRWVRGGGGGFGWVLLFCINAQCTL